jgi:hypothetical protein
MGIPADYKDADYFGNVPSSSHILTSARPNGSTESEGIGGETCPDTVM